MSGRAAVVLAATGRGRVHEESVAGFLREVGGCGEVVVVEGGRTTPHPNPLPQGERGPDSVSGLRILKSPRGCLVPELWREGLRAVDAELVAFSTTQMVPRDGWLRALMERLGESAAWGVGGAIAARERLGAVDRAVYLQRFLNYGPGMALPTRPSGENAIYRRDRLREVEDAWSEGFWEAEVHRRLEGQGATWAAEPSAVVDYAGSNRLGEIARQRVEHARRFGAGRGAVARVVRGLAAPVVPAVLLGRAGRGLIRRGMGVGPWLGALPSFLVIAGAWAAGEALGCWAGRARA
jgi:hypothetical protein